MVRLENDSKVNIGIPMKFESKGLKVLGYTRRNDRGWEYSETAARVLERYKAAFPEAFNNLGRGGEGLVTSAELCPTAEDPDKVIKDMKKWLVQEGLADLEAVSLFAEKLEQVSRLPPASCIRQKCRADTLNRRPWPRSKLLPIDSPRQRQWTRSSEPPFRVSPDKRS